MVVTQHKQLAKYAIVFIGRGCDSHSKAQHWFKKFREGNFCFEDLPMSGRPNEFKNERN